MCRPRRPRVRGSGRAARPGRCGGRCGRRCPGPKAAPLSSRNLRAPRTGREAVPPLGEGGRGTKPTSQGAAAGSPRAAASAPPADCAGCSGSRGHACAARDLGRGTRVRPPAGEGLRRERAARRSRESARRGDWPPGGFRSASDAEAPAGAGMPRGSWGNCEEGCGDPPSPRESGRPGDISEVGVLPGEALRNPFCVDRPAEGRTEGSVPPASATCWRRPCPVAPPASGTTC